jgi:thiosulfate/3-mercaptopyruvate sulfurtransferase
MNHSVVVRTPNLGSIKAMRKLVDRFRLMITAGLLVTSCAFTVRAQQTGTSIPSDVLIQPEELVRIVQSAKGPKPLMLQVGSNVLYAQAHIPGSEYAGAAANESGRQQLRKRVENLPRNKPIVIYCGCCPWSHCPNVNPAYQELRGMGFTNVRVLYIANNFGADWVDKGFPIAKGE